MILIIVDFQKDFISGSLAVKGAEKAMMNLVNLMWTKKKEISSCVTHKVYAIDKEKGCLIGNNKGHMNGWTKNVYGLAHKLNK